MIDKNEILKHLKAEDVSISVFDTLDSTNTYLKNIAKQRDVKEKTVVVAKEQTNGRGRLGRSFFSNAQNGIYLSLLLKPQISPQNALLITTCAAVSIAEVIQELFDINLSIKWVNDLYLNNRKIAGILTEAALSKDVNKLDFAVLGVGINLFQNIEDFPDDIKDIAGSLFKDNMPQNADNLIISAFLDKFLEYYDNLENKEFLSDYKKRLIYINKSVNVISQNEIYEATVLGIDDNFNLVVKTKDNKITALNSGEVSVKIK